MYDSGSIVIRVRIIIQAGVCLALIQHSHARNISPAVEAHMTLSVFLLAKGVSFVAIT